MLINFIVFKLFSVVFGKFLVVFGIYHRRCRVRRHVRCRPYDARSTRRLHCVAAGGDGVTAVHVDGGLRAVLSGAVLAGAATSVGKSAQAV